MYGKRVTTNFRTPRELEGDRIRARLPADFPADVFDAIADGMRRSAKRL